LHQQPFVPQGVAAKVSDTTMLLFVMQLVNKKIHLLPPQIKKQIIAFIS
jgi:hypothetical protein